MTAQCALHPRLRPTRCCPKGGPNMTSPTSDTSPRKRQSTASLPLNLCIFLTASVMIKDKILTQCAYSSCAVEIFSPLGHMGIWCSGNTPSLVLCNEESCSSIPSMSDSFYKNSNMCFKIHFHHH
jgi:hypothetical protein